MRKKLLAVLLLFGVFCASFSVCVSAAFEPPFDVNAAEIYMVNLDTDTVVYAKNETQPRAPASLTKMMTSLLLLENLDDLEGTEITAPSYIYDELYGMNASTADIRPYETVTAKTLLYAMLLPSANEAASITADYLGSGNLENFFYAMNARAKELGCVATHFTNAHGLFGMDHDHYSCAYDMYLIGRACYDAPGFMEVASSESYEMPFTNYHSTPEYASRPDVAYIIYSTNYLQRTSSPIYRSDVHGLKTGSTDEAGYNLVSTATKNGQTYMLVVMGTPYEKDEMGYGLAFSVTSQLYDWAFANYDVRAALDPQTPMQEIKVNLGEGADTVLLYPENSFTTLLPNEADETVLQKDFILPESVTAPIKEGDVIGAVRLSLAGEELGTVALVSHDNIERSDLLYAVSRVKAFLTGLYFRTVVVLFVLLIVCYVLLLRRLEKKRRRAQAGFGDGLEFHSKRR